MSNDPKKSPTMWTRGITLVVGVLSAIMLSIALFHSSGVSAQLEAWKLKPAPERYTELYFNQNVSLPTSVVQQPIIFSFNIHNAEGRLMSYPYTVGLKNANGSFTKLASGTLVIDDNAVSTVPETITLPKGATSAEVMVELPDQQQEIHFWLGATQ